MLIRIELSVEEIETLKRALEIASAWHKNDPKFGNLLTQIKNKQRSQSPS